MVRLKCVLKRFASRPFDRDRAIEMSSPPFHLGRYNPINWITCADHLRWTVSARDRCAIFCASSDPMHRERPRHLHFKERVGLSPTREKLRKAIGFIISGVSEGWIPIRYTEGWTLYTINYIKNIYIFAHVTLPRRRRVGLRGAATWPGVPRRIHLDPRKIINPFLHFLFNFNI